MALSVAEEKKYEEALNRVKQQARAKGRESVDTEEVFERSEKQGSGSSSGTLLFAFFVLMFFDIPKMALSYAALIPFLQWLYLIGQGWGLIGKGAVMLWMTIKGYPIFKSTRGVRNFFLTWAADWIGLFGNTLLVLSTLVEEKAEKALGKVTEKLPGGDNKNKEKGK